MRLPALLFRGENLALLLREEKGSEGSFRTLVRQYVRLRLVHRHSCSRWPPDSTASCRTRRRAVLSVVCAPLTGRGAAGGAVRRHPGPRHGALPPAGPPLCLPLFPLGLPTSFSSSRSLSLLLLSLPLPLIFCLCLLVPCRVCPSFVFLPPSCLSFPPFSSPAPPFSPPFWLRRRWKSRDLTCRFWQVKIRSPAQGMLTGKRFPGTDQQVSPSLHDFSVARSLSLFLSFFLFLSLSRSIYLSIYLCLFRSLYLYLVLFPHPPSSLYL